MVRYMIMDKFGPHNSREWTSRYEWTPCGSGHPIDDQTRLAAVAQVSVRWSLCPDPFDLAGLAGVVAPRGHDSDQRWRHCLPRCAKRLADQSHPRQLAQRRRYVRGIRAYRRPRRFTRPAAARRPVISDYDAFWHVPGQDVSGLPGRPPAWRWWFDDREVSGLREGGARVAVSGPESRGLGTSVRTGLAGG